MSADPFITFENETTQPCIIQVEPSGQDYTLLPHDEAAIFLTTLESDLSPSPPHLIVEEGRVSVTIDADFIVQVNGQVIDSGYQRHIVSRPAVELKIWLPAIPKKVYNLWTNIETLNQILSSPVVKNRERIKYKTTYIAYDGQVEWTPIMESHYQHLYFLWRTSDFPAGEINSHVELTLEDKDGGTTVNIAHRYLPTTLEKNWPEFWQQYFLGPLQKHFGALK